MSNLTAKATATSVAFRRPELDDATAVHGLVDECKPLDLNSPYSYMLLCTHFQETCVLAEDEDGIAGFVSAYKKPDDDATLFVWQVAVSSRMRGCGLAKRLLNELLSRPACRDAKWLETTITPSNRASWGLFESFADRRSASIDVQSMFREEHFGDESHEEEQLLRIGPLETHRR